MKLALLLAVMPAFAQTVCQPVPVFSVCEITFPGASPTADLKGEFRSPSHKTYLIPAFWNGSQTVLRVSPTEAGQWDFRISDGKEGQFTATASEAPGFIEAANVHHFRYSGSSNAHLWMGDTVPMLDRPAFEQFVNARARERFNHLRVSIVASILAGAGAPGAVFGRDEAHWRDLDERLSYMNRKGITADLVIAPDGEALTKLFPERQAREKFIRYLVTRYGAMNITWQGLENFESYPQGRELMKEIGGYLTSMDPYHHLVSTGCLITSSPLFDDGWMGYLTYRSADGVVPAIEHQIYKAPGVVDFRSTDKFRQRLWNATMTGAYPESAAPDEEAARQMKVWFDVMAGTRHWELEPYFDVEGGKALALEGVEYIVYVETPGAVSVTVAKRSYDVEWINPLNGEVVGMKNLKQETFTGEPPDRSHDWVLHISREGEKKSMAKSYRFESRDVLMQEVELNPAKIPFEIAQPATDSISLASPGGYAVKLKKETRATKTMLYMWTGEVTADGQSFRVMGVGEKGALQIPPNIVQRLPALLHLRVTAMNAYGKVFVSDRNVQLTK
jgi:hypothetical protein